MALLQHVCSVPLAREIRSRSLTISSCAVTVTVPSLKKLSHADSPVLLGMSEQKLRQVAADFGQVKPTPIIEQILFLFKCREYAAKGELF